MLTTCVTCRRYHGRPYQVNEGLLAPFRSQPSEPFAHTGLDFAGPIYVLEKKKVYVLLFTCAVIRAVHLEVCSDMSTESVASAYIRFVSRRGIPNTLYSDNALAFRKLSRSIDVPWKFIPEKSPWWGGWWERLIGVVKSALKKSLHLSALTFEELQTLLNFVEGVVNRLPLNYVSDQPD